MADLKESRDSTVLDPPPSKKLKTETETEEDAEVIRTEDGYIYRGKKFLNFSPSDEEYRRQGTLVEEQFTQSEGFDIDWDKFDYTFAIFNVDWQGPVSSRMSNHEILMKLIHYAIDEHNEEEGTNLEFVKYVKANGMPCKGTVYWITFWAKDMSSSNPEPKLYQTKVWKFVDEIEVDLFRLKPADK